MVSHLNCQVQSSAVCSKATFKSMYLTLDLWKLATFLKEMLDRLLPVREDALTDALHFVHVLIIPTP